MKTRTEQDLEFKNYFSYYANPGCLTCYGTGKDGWIEELKMYKLCSCVMENIKKELDKRSKIRESLIN